MNSKVAGLELVAPTNVPAPRTGVPRFLVEKAGK